MAINLDAASIRDEIKYMAEAEWITPEDAKRLSNLSDDDLDIAIDNAADDSFWDAWDAVRRDAINELISEMEVDEI